VADIASEDEFANAARGDGRSPDDARGVDDDAEAEFAAERFESFDTCLGVVAEAEVFALVDFSGVDGVEQDVGCEVAR